MSIIPYDILNENNNVINHAFRITRYDIQFGKPYGSMDYAQRVIASNPIGYWRMGTPTILNLGCFGGNYNLTLAPTNPTQVTSPVDPCFTCTSFDGTTQYASASTLPFNAASENFYFSFEFWIAPTRSKGKTHEETILCKEGGFRCVLDVNNALRVDLWVAGAWTTYVTSAITTSIPMQAGKAYHVGFSNGPVSAQFVINGVVDNVVNTGLLQPAESTHTFMLAATSLTASPIANTYYAGVLDEVAVYNFSLSTQVCNDHYSQGIQDFYYEPWQDIDTAPLTYVSTPGTSYESLVLAPGGNTPGPIHYYQLNEIASVTTLADSGSSPTTATVGGTTVASSVLPGATQDSSKNLAARKFGYGTSTNIYDCYAGGTAELSFGNLKPGSRTAFSFSCWFKMMCSPGFVNEGRWCDFIGIRDSRNTGIGFVLTSRGSQIGISLYVDGAPAGSSLSMGSGPNGGFAAHQFSTYGAINADLVGSDPDTWYHVAFTISETGLLKLYLNGALQPTNPYPTVQISDSKGFQIPYTDSSAFLSFGNCIGGSAIEAFGIDEVAMYLTELTAAQIYTQYMTGKFGSLFTTLNTGQNVNEYGTYSASCNTLPSLVNGTDITDFCLNFTITTNDKNVANSCALVCSEEWSSLLLNTYLTTNTYVTIEVNYTDATHTANNGWQSLGHFIVKGVGDTNRDAVGNSVLTRTFHLMSPISLLALDLVDTQTIQADLLQISQRPLKLTGAPANFYQFQCARPETLNPGVEITAATTASPVVVTTLSAHNLSDGEVVLIEGADGSGNLNINGEWYVLVTGYSSTTCALYYDALLTEPLVGSGTYVANSATLYLGPNYYYNWGSDRAAILTVTGLQNISSALFDESNPYALYRITGAEGSVQVLGGSGSVNINRQFFESAIKDGGLGFPKTQNGVLAQFEVYASPLDQTTNTVLRIGYDGQYYLGIKDNGMDFAGKTIYVNSGNALSKTYKIVADAIEYVNSSGVTGGLRLFTMTGQFMSAAHSQARWANPRNAFVSDAEYTTTPDSNASYTSSSLTNDYLVLTDPIYYGSVPKNAVLLGVTFIGLGYGTADSSTAYIKDHAVYFVAGNAIQSSYTNHANAAHWSTSPTVMTWGGDLWGYSGMNMTYASDPGFGVAIAVDYVNTSSTPNLQAALDSVTVLLTFGIWNPDIAVSESIEGSGGSSGALNYVDNAITLPWLQAYTLNFGVSTPGNSSYGGVSYWRDASNALGINPGYALTILAPAQVYLDASYGIAQTLTSYSLAGGHNLLVRVTPPTTQAGSLIVVIVVANSASMVATPFDNQGNTYTLRQTQVNGAYTTYYYDCINSIGNITTVSVNFDRYTDSALIVREYTGAIAGVDVYVSTNGSSTITATSGNTANTNYPAELVVGWCSTDGTTFETANNGFLNLAYQSSVVYNLTIADKAVTAEGPQQASFGTTSPSDFSCGTVTYHILGPQDYLNSVKAGTYALPYHSDTLQFRYIPSSFYTSIPVDSILLGIEVVMTRTGTTYVDPAGNQNWVEDDTIQLCIGGNLHGTNKAKTGYSNAWGGTAGSRDALLGGNFVLPMSVMETVTYGGPTDLWGLDTDTATAGYVDYPLTLLSSGDGVPFFGLQVICRAQYNTQAILQNGDFLAAAIDSCQIILHIGVPSGEVLEPAIFGYTPTGFRRLYVRSMYGFMVSPTYEGINVNDQLAIGNINSVEWNIRNALLRNGFQCVDPKAPLYFNIVPIDIPSGTSIPPRIINLTDSITWLEVVTDALKFAPPNYILYTNPQGVTTTVNAVQKTLGASDHTLHSVLHNVIGGDDSTIATRVIALGLGGDSVDVGLHATFGGQSAIRAYWLTNFFDPNDDGVDTNDLGNTLTQVQANTTLAYIFDANPKTPGPSNTRLLTGGSYGAETDISYGLIYQCAGPRVSRTFMQMADIFCLDFGREAVSNKEFLIDAVAVGFDDTYGTFGGGQFTSQTLVLWYMTENDYIAEYGTYPPDVPSQASADLTTGTYMPDAQAVSWKQLTQEFHCTPGLFTIESSTFIGGKPLQFRFLKVTVGEPHYGWAFGADGKSPYAGDWYTIARVVINQINIWTSQVITATAELGNTQGMDTAYFKQLAQALRRRTVVLAKNDYLTTYPSAVQFASQQLYELFQNFRPWATTAICPGIDITQTVTLWDETMQSWRTFIVREYQFTADNMQATLTLADYLTYAPAGALPQSST